MGEPWLGAQQPIARLFVAHPTGQQRGEEGHLTGLGLIVELEFGIRPADTNDATKVEQ
jgi:hypothetical protein